MKRTMRFLPVKAAGLLAGLVAAVVATGQPAHATNTCFTYTPGHVYYVAYQNNPAGAEYIVDLGDRNTFLNATTMLPLGDISAGDFSTIFAPAATNLWVGFLGVANPATRDAIVAANGPRDDGQLNNSSIIGAAQQTDSWATGIVQFSSEVGNAPCHLNAARFPGKIFGSYQDTLNGQFQGSAAGNLVWNIETRLSTAAGVRLQSNKIKFNRAISNASGSARAPVGYFIVYVDGTADFWPDDDGDLLPDVAPGSDPEADKCLGLNSTDNTDADADNHAAPCDCNEASNTVWAVPTEATGIAFSTKTNFSWNAPSELGGTATKYDVFRAQQASPGAIPAFNCFAPDLSTTTSSDGGTPTGSLPFLYLVRARTTCGGGTVGQGRNAPARVVPACP